MLLWWWSSVFLMGILRFRAQQTYVDSGQFDCNTNYTTTLGYTCNGAPSCRSYFTFRPQPPLYDTTSSIAALLNADANDITAFHYFFSTTATIPADTIMVVPIRNCSCSESGFYQHKANYELKSTDETYFTVANNTYEGLTTCRAVNTQNQNKYNFHNFTIGENITVPLRCACPTANQTAAGIKSLLTYSITWGDNFDYISGLFTDVTVHGILDANELSPMSLILPFTPILIPLTTEPTSIITSSPPALSPDIPVIPVAPPAIPMIPVAPTSGGRSSSNLVFVGVGISVCLLLIISLFVCFFKKRKIQHHHNTLSLAKYFLSTGLNPWDKNSWFISSEKIRNAIGSLTVYKYEELQTATGDFSEENRVKGSVYKGVFNGDSAAVKIMKGNVSGEINILNQINHSNITRLFGFCLHHGNTYLVYEFADNGSLSDWLRPETKNIKHDLGLGWKQRVQIAQDVAQALNYLHNFITPPYVHKNLTSSNVLLGAQMRGKITNFGLARVNNDGELQLTRVVVGAIGYMPPEYIENGVITFKSDVFALGVVISELLSGKEANVRQSEDGGGEKDVKLSEMIKEVVGGDKLVGFMDGRLRGEYPVDLAYSMAELARKCVAADLNDRPSVAEVFVSLSKIMSSSLDWDPSKIS